MNKLNEAYKKSIKIILTCVDIDTARQVCDNFNRYSSHISKESDSLDVKERVKNMNIGLREIIIAKYDLEINFCYDIKGSKRANILHLQKQV